MGVRIITGKYFRATTITIYDSNASNPEVKSRKRTIESVVFTILTPLDTRSKPMIGPAETVQTETFSFNFVRELVDTLFFDCH
jgi:hypothetical protein